MLNGQFVSSVSGSGDRLSIIKAWSNKRIKYTSQQAIILCINIIFVYEHNCNILKQTFVIWIMANGINSICADKASTNINSDNKLNKNGIVYHALDKSIIIMFMIKYYDEFDANMNKIYLICQIPNETNNFDLSITIIKVYDLVLYQMTKVTNQACLFVVIHCCMRQILEYVLYDNDSRLFHLIATKMHDFKLIIAVINEINTFTVQVDHSYLFLSMIIWELLMILMNLFKLFFISSYTNFSFSIDKNMFLYIVMDEKLLISTILLILIIIIGQFYAIPCIIIYLNVEINNKQTFQSQSNHNSPITQSNNCNRTKHITQQTNIFKIILCINIIFIHQYNANIFCEVSDMCIIWVPIIAIHSVCCYQLRANSGNNYTLNIQNIFGYPLNQNTTNTFATISYGKFVADMYKMYEFYGIVDKYIILIYL